MTLRQRFAIHVRKRPYTFTQTKILFWNLHIANVVLLFVLPVIMFVFFKKNVYFSIIQVSKMALMVAIMRCEEWKFLFLTPYTAQKMKFSIKDFSSKCDFFSFLRIWSHIKKKFLISEIQVKVCYAAFTSYQWPSIKEFYRSLWEWRWFKGNR